VKPDLEARRQRAARAARKAKLKGREKAVGWAWHGSKIEEMDSRRETKGQEKRMEPKNLGQSRKPFRMDMLKASGILFLLINIKHFKHSNNKIFKDHHGAEVLEERRQAKEERQRREALGECLSASSCGRVGKILIGKQ